MLDSEVELNEIKFDIPLTNPPTQYIEIDDVSDSYDPREELKKGDKPNKDVDHYDDCDLSSL